MKICPDLYSKKLKYLLCLILVLTLPSCDELIEVDNPITKTVPADAFKDDGSALSVIRGIYSEMISLPGFASGYLYSITLVTGFSSDEFLPLNGGGSVTVFYDNALTADNTVVQELWKDGYQYIYYANAALEGLANTTGVTESLRAQLEGQAQFIRAFCYFYLVNLFGDVPLITTTNHEVNAKAPRAPTSQVYDLIISDLKAAELGLADDYSLSLHQRVMPNRSVASALLARVYLYTGNWGMAEAKATTVINNPTYSLEVDLCSVFLKNSSEALWQLLPVTPTFNTFEGYYFIPEPPFFYTALSPHVFNAFESSDKRKTAWVNSYANGANTWHYPFKYKVRASAELTEYSMVMRLAEQYLIRAEARAQQDNINGAQEDLNAIRNRAGLPNTTAESKAAILSAVEHERRIELFAEWGHRWLDLKRTNRANTVLSAAKGGVNWKSTDALYPIPQSEIKINPNLTPNPE